MRGRLVGIDGIRGVAAIIVVLRHFGGGIADFFGHGHLAVDLFFMLSGWVLAAIYEPRFEQGLRPLAYMGHRLARLYPLLALGSLIGLVFYSQGLGRIDPTTGPDPLSIIAEQFLFLPFATSQIAFYVLNTPQWSIVYELVVNFLHSVIHRRLSTPVLAALIVLTAVLTAGTALTHGSLDYGWYKRDFAVGIIRACFGFFLGVALCRLAPRLPSSGRFGLTIAALAMVVVAADPFGIGNHSATAAVYELSVLFVVLPFIVIVAAKAPAGRIAAALGRLSFPLYAIHLPFVFALKKAGAAPTVRLLACAALIVLAYAIGKWVDEPFMAWRHARKGRRAATAGHAAAF